VGDCPQVLMQYIESKHPNWLQTLKEEILSQTYLADTSVPPGHICSAPNANTLMNSRECTLENLKEINLNANNIITTQNSQRNIDAVEVASS